MMPAREKSTKHKVRGLGSLHQRAEGGNYHLQFSVNGRQYRESAHTYEYNQAVKVLKRRITEVATGKFQGTQIDRTPMSELFADVIADYELKDRHSVDSMARPLIDNWLAPVFGKMRAANVKISAITAYIKKRKDEKAAVASINRELGLLRRAFKLGNFNQKVGIANVPNFKGLLQRELNARHGFWEHTEYAAFRDALALDARGPFVFAYWTGCRYGEIVQIEWSQVDLDGRAVRLHEDQTKAGEARVIPLGGPGSDLYDMLVAQKIRHDELCPASPWVFFHQGSSKRRYPVRRGQQLLDLRKPWAKAVVATGVDRLFHDLRRTGVRNLIRAGVPEKVAMLISGHKTRSVFSRYNIVDERDLHAAAEKLNQFLNGKKEDSK
jgi:integrase